MEIAITVLTTQETSNLRPMLRELSMVGAAEGAQTRPGLRVCFSLE